MSKQLAVKQSVSEAISQLSSQAINKLASQAVKLASFKLRLAWHSLAITCFD